MAVIFWCDESMIRLACERFNHSQNLVSATSLPKYLFSLSSVIRACIMDHYAFSKNCCQLMLFVVETVAHVRV